MEALFYYGLGTGIVATVFVFLVIVPKWGSTKSGGTGGRGTDKAKKQRH